MLEPLSLGRVRIDPPLVLAPMEGLTDVYLRRLVRRAGGCGLLCAEFLPAAALPTRSRKLLRMARVDADEHPISMQLYGREPALMARGARILVEEYGADVVDLNMGCPSKRVVRRSGGASLMREPLLAARIVEAVVAAVDVPVTVKMRAGWSAEELNAPELARLCQEAGAALVAVHWRTRTEGYGGTRDLSRVRAVVEAVDVPVLANGDVVDVGSALHTLQQTGAAGLMIGRGAVRDPWVFSAIAASLQGEEPRSPDRAQRARVLVEHLDALVADFDSVRGALGRFKAVAGLYAHNLGDEDLRRALLRASTVEEVRGVLEGVS